MEKKYEALQTKSFTDGQALADIIKGHKYLADKDQEYFIGEFGEKVYIRQDEFDTYLRPIKIKAYQLKAKNNYAKSGKNTIVYLTLFPDKDQDIIDRLEEVKETAESKFLSKGGRGGKNEYIRQLIREDIARNKGGN